jgi:hypothetical protein
MARRTWSIAIVKISTPESAKPSAGNTGPCKSLSQLNTRMNYPAGGTRRQRRLSAQSPISELPLFNRIWRARNLAQMYVALDALVPKLLRRGQDASNIASDLSQLAHQARGAHLHMAVVPMVNDIGMAWAQRRSAE